MSETIVVGGRPARITHVEMCGWVIESIDGCFHFSPPGQWASKSDGAWPTREAAIGKEGT